MLHTAWELPRPKIRTPHVTFLLFFCSFYRSALVMASSVVQAVSGIWRSHSALDESDGPDSTPEAPQRSYSSSPLRSLRVSLRTRLPLRPVEAQAGAPPTRELAPHPGHKLRLLTRSARSSIGGAYQVRESCVTV